MFQVNQKSIMQKFFFMLLAISFVILICVNLLWGNHWINSDMSAELIFSDLLKSEGHLIASENWYYSTEFRVLYTQLIMVPLLYLFDDWTTVRILTNIFFYVGMFFSYAFVCKQLHISRKYLYATSLALFIPISETVMTHVQMGNTYMSHIILIYLCYGLFLKLVASTTARQKEMKAWASYGILAFLLGTSGVRYLLDVFAPIMITAVVVMMKSKSFLEFRKHSNVDACKKLVSNACMSYLYVGLIGSVIAAVGYVYNAIVLAHRYPFQTYSETNFIPIQGGVLLERIQNAIGSMLQLFGYIENKGFISLHGIITMISFVVIVALIYIWKNCSHMYPVDEKEYITQESFTVNFVAISMLFHIFIFVFTTSTMVDRYYIPIVMFILPVVAFYMKRVDYKVDKYIVACLLLGCLFLMGVKTMYSIATNDKNADRYEIIQELEDAGYTFGYASYWNSNITTELSNGKIEMANLWSIDSLGIFKWSSTKSAYEEKEGPVFLLIDQQELEAAQKHGIDQNQRVVCENETYIVYDFENQAQFLEYREAVQNKE